MKRLGSGVQIWAKYIFSSYLDKQDSRVALFLDVTSQILRQPRVYQRSDAGLEGDRIIE